MIAYPTKRLPQLVVQWLYSGGSAVYCKFGTLTWMGWPSGVLWGGPLICSLVVAAVGSDIFPDASRVRSPRMFVWKDSDT